MSISIKSISIVTVLRLFGGSMVHAEDGYRLWLRYDPLRRERALATGIFNAREPLGGSPDRGREIAGLAQSEKEPGDAEAQGRSRQRMARRGEAPECE